MHLLNSKEWMVVLNVDHKAPYVQVSGLNNDDDDDDDDDDIGFIKCMTYVVWVAFLQSF